MRAIPGHFIQVPAYHVDFALIFQVNGQTADAMRDEWNDPDPYDGLETESNVSVVACQWSNVFGDRRPLLESLPPSDDDNRVDRLEDVLHA